MCSARPGYETISQVSKTLSKLGWAIAIVPESDDITVGGLLAVKSSSRIYGLFQKICESFKLVLVDDSSKCKN